MIWGQYNDFEIWCVQKWDLAKSCSHGRERAFCALFIEITLFSRFGDDLRPVRRFWDLVCSKVGFCQTCSAWPKTCVLYIFHRTRTAFLIWRWFGASSTILWSSVRSSDTLRKLARYGPKRAYCERFTEIALLFRFGDDLRPVRRFWNMVCGNVTLCENLLCNLLRRAPNEYPS